MKTFSYFFVLLGGKNMEHVLIIMSLVNCTFGLWLTDYATTNTTTKLNIENTKVNSLIHQLKGYSKCEGASTKLMLTDSETLVNFIIEAFASQSASVSLCYNPSCSSSKHNLKPKTPEYDLACDQYKGYWMTWQNGIVQAGSGTEIGVNLRWNVSFPRLLSDTPKYVDLFTHRFYYRMAPPFNSNPQITTSPSQVQWSDTDKDGLTDTKSHQCLPITATIYLKLKLDQVFSPHLLNKFDVKVVTVSMDCSDDSFYIYVPLTSSGSQPFEESFQQCEFVKQETVNGKQSCDFKCQCKCDGFFLQKFNILPGAQLCGVYYP